MTTMTFEIGQKFEGSDVQILPKGAVVLDQEGEPHALSGGGTYLFTDGAAVYGKVFTLIHLPAAKPDLTDRQEVATRLFQAANQTPGEIPGPGAVVLYNRMADWVLENFDPKDGRPLADGDRVKVNGPALYGDVVLLGATGRVMKARDIDGDTEVELDERSENGRTIVYFKPEDLVRI